MTLSSWRPKTLNLLAASFVIGSCAYGVQQSRGDLHVDLGTSDYRFAIISPESERPSRVESALHDRGYLTLGLGAVRDLESRRIGVGQVLLVSCTYLGQVDKDALGTTAAQVSCTADDLITGKAVYTGLGENVAMTLDGDIDGATTAALRNLPSRGDGKGGVATLPDVREAFPELSPTVSQAPSKAGTAVRVAPQSLVTNLHVVEGCRDIRNAESGEVLRLIRGDAATDLALLHSDASGDVVALRAPPAPRAGDEVVVLGFPLRGILSSEMQVTSGVISALSGIDNDTRLLQVTAPVQPGNSGGPLLDRSGHLIGIVVSKLAAAEVWRLTGALPENVNFAISGDVVRIFLDVSEVEYSFGNESEILAIADVAQRGGQSTIPVECR